MQVHVQVVNNWSVAYVRGRVLPPLMSHAIILRLGPNGGRVIIIRFVMLLIIMIISTRILTALYIRNRLLGATGVITLSSLN